jgi:pathogenesis-related protein 1
VRRTVFIMLMLLAPVAAHAVFLDCLFFDGLENPGTTNAAELGALKVHNCARKTVTPAANPAIPILTWNSTVATAAQTWANGCVYAHGGIGSYGQNIYAASGFVPTLSDAGTDWASEQPYYNYAANSCSTANPPNTAGTCGHYTQVVWKTTTQLGCGQMFCTTNSPFPPPFTNWYLIVCDYNPAGNAGGRPY